MGKIPDMSYGKVVNAGTEMQLGCVYCLGENLEAPVEYGQLYMWQGTSLCARHVRIVASGGSGGSTA